MKTIVDKLRGGDRRSIGRAGEVAREISTNPKLFAQVLAATLDADPLVRMRAADAIEKASGLNSQFLQSHKRIILNKIAAIP